MPMPNTFEADPFSLIAPTAAINDEKYRPGQISATGIFEESGVATTKVFIERRNGRLGLVEPSQRGGPGETTGDTERDALPFKIPHYERDDAVLADEVQDRRQFRTENSPETVSFRVAEKLRRHGQDLTMTLEHQRVGAIKGTVTTKGGRVLENLYTRFGISPADDVVIALSSEATDVGSEIDAVRYSMEDSLDENYGGIHAFTGRDFHTAMWRHKSVKETLLSHAGALELRNAVPDTFDFGGITWERYKNGVAAQADLGANYIAHDEARIVPTGVPELFITRFGPADYEDTVNEIGLPFYAREFAMPNNKGRHLEIQMNAISLCTRPEVLRRLTMS